MKAKEVRFWQGAQDGPWPFIETRGELAPAEREWLHTNGAGAYAMSTIALMHTRRYHGVFVAPLDPPFGRHVILSHAETQVTVDAERKSYRTATHQFPNLAPTPGYRYLHSFAQDPLPRWIFRLGKDQLERRLCLVRGKNAGLVSYTWHGRTPARVTVRPLMPLRPVDELMREHGAMNQVVLLRSGAVVVQPVASLPPIMFAHDGVFMGSPDWWRRFEYLGDRAQGSGFEEDMWTPGVFELRLEPQKPTYLVFSLGPLPDGSPADLMAEAREALLAFDPGPSSPKVVRWLSVASEQYCLEQCARPFLAAGYPWHGLFTRDALLSIGGLCLARGRIQLAKRTLQTLLSKQRFGLLPECLVAPGAKRAKPVPDATLWLFEVAKNLRGFLPPQDNFMSQRLYPALRRAFLRVRLGRTWVWLSPDGLVVNSAQSAALTWMDAHLGSACVTPRRGLAVEMQALWTRACAILAEFAHDYREARLENLALEHLDRARSAFRARFWCHETDYPYDCISELGDVTEAWVDPSIRPNALIALAVDPSLFEPWQAEAILQRVSSDLLTSRGIRSLAPNDPRYIGQFAGTLEEREMAYHQGTAWLHLLGFFVRASLQSAPDDPELREELRRRIEQASDEGAVLGQLPQLADGDPPHRARGCPAQATSVAQLLQALVLELGV